MALNGDWMVSKMYQQYSRLNGDWKVTEWRLSIFTERWHFILYIDQSKRSHLNLNRCWTISANSVSEQLFKIEKQTAICLSVDKNMGHRWYWRQTIKIIIYIHLYVIINLICIYVDCFVYRSHSPWICVVHVFIW